MDFRAVHVCCLLGLALSCACAEEDASARGGVRAQEVAPVAASCDAPASAFAALEARVFESRGCTAQACHGERAAGGLRLTRGDAHAALVGVPARASGMKRVQPGAPELSFLYRKLRAATEPDSVPVEGSPMPVGLAPLTPDELAAVRAWIAAGAPDASVADTRALRSDVTERLGSCGAPPPSGPPAGDAPLAVPAAERGLQLRMPAHLAPPDSEWEGCYATYYDLTDVVPARYHSKNGRAFHVGWTEMRQSAGSHHMAAFPTGMGAERVRDAAFGAWTCKGGAKRGAACDPLDAEACGADGVCASAPKAAVACFGFGPFGSFVDASQFGLGKSPKPYLVNQAIPGVYRDLPLKQIVYWNLHAYNLTDRAREQTGEINLWYTDDARHAEQTVSITTPEFAGIAPFSKRDVCGTWRAPRGSSLIRLSSHTHRHGERFWILDAAGTRIYESLDYANSLTLTIDPPRVFDAAEAAQRTLTYCATFNNGVRPDGSPDTQLVTRRSRIPPGATTCVPTACAAGRVGAPCKGTRDHASCDSSRGRGDGLCDACPITSGETTEHEMFIMHPDHVLTVLR